MRNNAIIFDMKKKEIGIVIVVAMVALVLLWYFKRPKTSQSQSEPIASTEPTAEATATPEAEETTTPEVSEEPEETATSEPSASADSEEDTGFVSQSGAVVAVQWRNDIVLEFDPYVDAIYDVDGDTGGLQVEVQDGKWHVTNEQCPNHICASMGWMGMDDIAIPITCLPNNIIIYIEEYPAE